MENIIDRPLDPPEVEDLEKPDGFELLRQLPYMTAHEILRDAVNETVPGCNKYFLQKAFDELFVGEHCRRRWESGSVWSTSDYIEWQTQMRKVWFTLVAAATQGGETRFAEDEWRRGK